ncbi:hypothetical protein [Stappia sp.]|uniref:hypothetical protein n=1 Tax=Stappia sp. TaxID=1870903 RepID=UPI003C7D3740
MNCRALVFSAFFSVCASNTVLVSQGEALASDGVAGSRLDDTYTNLITEERWAAAYEYLKGSSVLQDRLMIAHHLFLGVGTSQDPCAAVRILEDQWTPNAIMATSVLELIYGSGWPAIASQEGSGPASYALGTYYLNNSNRDFSKLLGTELFFIEKAYVNFKRSEYFGFQPARKTLDTLEYEFPHLKGVPVGYDTKPVVCDRR